MKQPLMVTPSRIPPAQAEALYDVALTEAERGSPPDMTGWPDEDWDDDSPSLHRSPVPSKAGKGRVAQH
jgi:hypothetical protein